MRNIGVNTWEMRITFPRDALTGKQPSRTKVFHGAYEEAVAERASMLAQASMSPRGGARATVGDLTDAWLARCEDRNKRGALADSTFENYAYQVRRLRTSAPNFLAIRLSKLDSSEPVEELLKGLEEDHHVGQSRPRPNAQGDTRCDGVGDRAQVAEVQRRQVRRGQTVAPAEEDAEGDG